MRGHFNSVGFRIQSDLTELARDKFMIERFPVLSDLVKQLGDKLYEIEKKIDYDISGDTKLRMDDASAEKEFLADLLEICMKSAPREMGNHSGSPGKSKKWEVS